jgi:dolichyl-phosphate beta-glucosyltransferase
MARTLTIVVPAFNEERRLPALLQALRADADAIVSASGLELRQVIVVDDGSNDGTAAQLVRFDGLPGRFDTVRFEENRGKGAAVRAGMLRAESSFGLMTDVDLSTPLDELAGLAAAAHRGADVAIASRALRDSRIVVHQPLHRELMGKSFNLGVRLLTRVPWHDTQCGFKLFRLETTRRLFEFQRVDGFAFDLELLVIARRLGLSIAELPVRWIDHPESHVGLFNSSAGMALDAIRIAYRARRPLPALTRES